jgi:radical SAM superfamily enzyme YgiQ (UPF0313 family)
MLELADAIYSNSNNEEIHGTAKRISGKYKINQERNFIKDISILPLPARQLFDIEKKSVMRLITSRGCPYKCTFCAASKIWKHTIRFNTIEKVINEIDMVINRYGCKNIFIVDDNFTVDKTRCMRILNELSRKKAAFTCLARIDALDEELLDAMKLGNIKTISLGCESGNNEVLNKIDKKITAESIRKCLKLVKKFDISVRTSWMWGLPFDTIDSLDDTVQLILNEEPEEVVFYRYVPYPGTALFDISKDTINLSYNELYSGMPKFVISTETLSIDTLEHEFQRAMEVLISNGYSIENGIGNKKLTTSFSKYKTFWPSESNS